MRIALPPTIAPEGLSGHDPSAAVIDLAGETMGTTWSARYAAPPRGDPARVRAAIVARLAGLVAEMSHWEQDSLLSRFNRSAAGTWTTLPADFAHVMAHGLTIAGQTGGAFDPTIGAVANLWGFGPAGLDCLTPPAPSAPAGRGAAIRAARATSGHHRLAYETVSRLLRQPGGLLLDLSGIAKGYAVDAIADLLAMHGIAHCLVEIGGELVGRGVRPDGDPWWVDLENPPNFPLPPLRIALHGLAVATSGDYRRGAHTLDPRTGYPIDNHVASVSVIHSTALAADAWATALTVLGPRQGAILANRAGIAARWITVAGGTPQEDMSLPLAAMLDA